VRMEALALWPNIAAAPQRTDSGRIPRPLAVDARAPRRVVKPGVARAEGARAAARPGAFDTTTCPPCAAGARSHFSGRGLRPWPLSSRTDHRPPREPERACGAVPTAAVGPVSARKSSRQGLRAGADSVSISCNAAPCRRARSRSYQSSFRLRWAPPGHRRKRASCPEASLWSRGAPSGMGELPNWDSVFLQWARKSQAIVDASSAAIARGLPRSGTWPTPRCSWLLSARIR
jgi:hypothetical protein